MRGDPHTKRPVEEAAPLYGSDRSRQLLSPLQGLAHPSQRD